MRMELATGITGRKGQHPRGTASREASRYLHTVPFSPCSAHFSRAPCALCYFRKHVKRQEGSQKLGGICRCFMSLGDFHHSLSEWKHLPHSLHMMPRLPSGPRTPQRGTVTFREKNRKQDSSLNGRVSSRLPVFPTAAWQVTLDKATKVS